jgi:2-polyprenyl-3-methyl-5-hydroxy-6-metoxy-1,4-benzoquinol methylase
VLADFLPKAVQYAGIEPSAKAAASAAAKVNCQHTTAENFDPEQERWDCVIFNEMLYYSQAPGMMLQKFSEALRPNGIIIVSIYQKQASWRDRVKLSMNNSRCTSIVKKFIAREGWVIERQQQVSNAGREPWWLLVARPQS